MERRGGRMGPQHRRVDPELKEGARTVSAEFHHSMAGVALLLSVSVLSFALGVCVGVALMLLS